MPIKFRTKSYKGSTYYHIYNRGLDGRDVFVEDSDYLYFLQAVERYLMPAQKDSHRYKKKPSDLKREQALNLATEVDMTAYCLLPNHFHFLVYQHTKDGITKFMRRVMTGYVMYFNKKYKRHGPLFETNYRAVIIDGGEKVAAMTKYIHLNPVTRTVRRFGPVETVSASRPDKYLYSSYLSYIGININKWVKKYKSVFDGQSYQEYVEGGKNESEKILGELVLE